MSEPRFEHNGLREVTFKSPSLRGRADMTLFVPDGADASQPLPLVVLLHGVYGSHWAWTRKGGAHHTARRLISSGGIPPMVLAMPSDGLWGDGSGYVTHTAAGGADYEKFIVEEVPLCVAEVVPAVGPAPRPFICGLSMGGFGALRLGAKYPQRFAGISGHSSMTHFAQMARFLEEPLAQIGPLPEHEQSVLHWIAEHADRLPPVRFDCGTEDQLIAVNRELHQSLAERGIGHSYEEFAGGHTWGYWEEHLADSLRFFARVASAGACPECGHPRSDAPMAG